MNFRDERLQFTLRPIDLINEMAWRNRSRGRWIDVEICPFCGGGDQRDRHTFAVHSADGNFTCLRSTCGRSGSFWQLLESVGKDPKDYLDRDGSGFRKSGLKQKKKGYIYGKNGSK